MSRYFKGLYRRTMNQAYGLASDEIFSALSNGGECLDCGANKGHWYDKLSAEVGLTKDQYFGVEWNQVCVDEAKNKGLNVKQGDLNKKFEFENDKFTCIFALSVIEHLLNGCHFLKECHRTLNNNGKLVLLTPNISTYFTAFLILAGKMPSSGPQPDSDSLIKSEELFKVSSEHLNPDTESDTPVHRHLIVFSFRVMKKYLEMIGFSDVRGYGFGLYPFPNFTQPVLEKIDPWHCHQMVFIAHK